ncbi:MAG: hypothetical protein AAFN17_03175, partial [Pseudomonadota bacterium]
MKRYLTMTTCLGIAGAAHVGMLLAIGGWQGGSTAPSAVEVAQTPPAEAELKGMDDELTALLEQWDEEPGSAEPVEVAGLDHVDQTRPDAAEDLFAAPESGPPPEKTENTSTAEAVPEEWDIPSQVRVASGVAPELGASLALGADSPSLSAPSLAAPSLGGIGTPPGGVPGSSVGGGLAGGTGDGPSFGGALAIAPRLEDDPFEAPVAPPEEEETVDTAAAEEEQTAEDPVEVAAEEVTAPPAEDVAEADAEDTTAVAETADETASEVTEEAEEVETAETDVEAVEEAAEAEAAPADTTEEIDLAEAEIAAAEEETAEEAPTEPEVAETEADAEIEAE